MSPNNNNNKITTQRGLSSKVKLVATIGIIVVLITSFIVYFILQTQDEEQIRNAIFDKEQQRQIVYARSVAQNMASDLDSLMNRLYALSISRPIQDANFSSSEADKLLIQAYDAANNLSSVDGVYILDQNNKVVNYANPSIPKPGYIGYDTSQLPVVKEYLNNLSKPYFSLAYKSVVNATLKISLYYPIYDVDSDKYLGAVAMSLAARPFLEKYGNLDDVNQQYINVLDKNATFLTAPVKTSIGKNFFSKELSSGSPNEAVELYKTVLSGQEYTTLFSFRNFGSRLATGEPVIIGGKPQYFVFVITPTATIFSEIDSVISSQRTDFYILQGAIAGAIAIALFFLIRWSGTIEKAIKDRTSELQRSNDKLVAATEQLKDANMQLKAHDEMQREFINIAAHELRTPVQPILGIAEMLGAYPANAEDEEEDEKEVRVKKSDLQVIGRNALRLERLSSDILDVSRIESGQLRLTTEKFDLNKLVEEAIDDAQSHINAEKVIITKTPSGEPINIVADRQRIMQVLSNLLTNAIRFTRPDGNINVILEREDDSAKITIKDTGTGISDEVQPRLFTKFSSTIRQRSGTGLGLFISKAIIEGHGGKIWAENNADGRGATFTFKIPLVAQIKPTDPTSLPNDNENNHNIMVKMLKEPDNNK